MYLQRLNQTWQAGLIRTGYIQTMYRDTTTTPVHLIENRETVSRNKNNSNLLKAVHSNPHYDVDMLKRRQSVFTVKYLGVCTFKSKTDKSVSQQGDQSQK